MIAGDRRGSTSSCSSSRSRSSSCSTSSSGGSCAPRAATCALPQESFILAARGCRRARVAAARSPAASSWSRARRLRTATLRARLRAADDRPRRQNDIADRRRTSMRRRATRASSRGTTASGSQDLGSTNGTFVNGTRSTRPRRLAPGDIVRVGETDLRYEHVSARGRTRCSTRSGRKRRRNEDAYVVEPPLFAVADGMGGAQAGEVASRLAAAALKESGADERRGERVDVADPGGEPPRVRPLERRPERLRHGDDDDRRARRERAASPSGM